MGVPRGITEFKFTSALDYASGTATRNGATLDMLGYRGVLMVVKFATIAASAVAWIKAQQAAASNMSGAADLYGTGQTVAADDDGQIFVIDLWEPVERYVRLVVHKDAANAVAEMAWYLQYAAIDRPVTVAVTDLVTYERHASPIEGLS